MESSSVENREVLLARSTENYYLYKEEKDKYEQLLKEIKEKDSMIKRLREDLWAQDKKNQETAGARLKIISEAK